MTNHFVPNPMFQLSISNCKLHKTRIRNKSLTFLSEIFRKAATRFVNIRALRV